LVAVVNNDIISKVARDELKASRAIHKIEEAKKNGMWSLKQHKRHRAIARTKTHWDSLIDEMVRIS
jgi:hypothetical protein